MEAGFNSFSWNEIYPDEIFDSNGEFPFGGKSRKIAGPGKRHNLLFAMADVYCQQFFYLESMFF